MNDSGLLVRVECVVKLLWIIDCMWRNNGIIRIPTCGVAESGGSICDGRRLSSGVFKSDHYIQTHT